MISDLEKLIEIKTLELQSETFKFLTNQQNMTTEEITNYKGLISLQKELTDLERYLKTQTDRDCKLNEEFLEFEDNYFEELEKNIHETM